MHNDIPFDWTADQALAVLEFLEDLAEWIWSRYGLAIRECSREQGPHVATTQLTLPFPPLWKHMRYIDENRTDDDIPW